MYPPDEPRIFNLLKIVYSSADTKYPPDEPRIFNPLKIAYSSADTDW